MKILNVMIVKSFLSVFLFALLFFVLILQLVDLFSNLWRYLNNDVTIFQILQVAYFYMPKCIAFSIPPALLFSISFTLGNYYSNNELISIFGSGISLFRFIFPLWVIGFFLSAGGFFFDEYVVIDSFKQKNEMTKTLLKQQVSFSNTNITVLSRNSTVIYQADYYNDKNQTLSGVTVLELDTEGKFVQRIDAEQATWKEGVWEFHRSRVFFWDEQNEFITELKSDSFLKEQYDEPPSTFRKTIRNVEEMRMKEAREWVGTLKRAGLPFRGAQTEYYKRFAFAFTPIIVTFISSVLGGRFRKNILLMSLLASLVITVVYYVIQMILVLFAKLGYIPPTAGAWGTLIFFFIPSIWLFRIART